MKTIPHTLRGALRLRRSVAISFLSLLGLLLAAAFIWQRTAASGQPLHPRAADSALQLMARTVPGRALLATFFAQQTAPSGNDTRVAASVAATESGNFTTPQAVPTLGTYAAANVALSGQTTVTPSAAPTNATSLVATASSGFNGTLRADPTTGVVSIVNAHPAGTHTITVNAFGGSGMTTASFQLTVQTGTACGTVPLFTSAANVTGVHSPLGTAVGDFNNDGVQDLVTANGSNATASIRLGDGAGGFTGTTVSTPTNPNAVAVGDFNGDGNQDIAVSSSNNAVAIRLGNGTGGFTGTTNITTGQTTKSIALGDFNNDGKLDFVTADIGGDNATVALGNGAGGFPTVSNVSVGDGPGQVVVADFNSDGNLDFATSNQIFNPPGGFGSPGTVTVRIGDGVGGFTNGPSYNVGNNPEYLAVGDFNEDGKPDLITSNQNSASLSLILGDVSNTMAPPTPTTIAVSSGPGEIRVADINNDGHQDVAFKRSGLENFAYLLGTGTGSFGTAVIVSVTGAAGTKLALGDFNGDGRQDFVTANFGSNTLFVQLGGCNIAPTITAGGPLTRQQGSAGSSDTIATVNDTETLKENLTVTVMSAPTGISVTSISAPNATTGVVTATVAAGCNAAPGDNTVVLKVTDSNGTTATANLTVNVTAATPPTMSNAGPDQTLCATAPATLAANPPSVGTGAWSIVSGPSTSTAQFSSLTNPAATFTPAVGTGTYTLRWTITGVCATSTDDVRLTYNANPTTANAGPDQNFCGTSVATLAANTPGTGTGAWTVVSGPSMLASQFSNANSPTATFTPAGGTGIYTLRWTISNAPCTASTDDVVLRYNAQPTITLGASPSVFPGTTSAHLPYTATTGSPNQYSIDYDTAANTAGFVDVTNAALPASPLVLVVPGAAAPSVYNATLTVRNSTTGCVSSAVPFTITIATCPSLFTVNNTGEATDATPGNGVCETATGNSICTLRAALQEANALTACSPITINFSVTGTILLTSNLPTIAHPNLTITGPGANQLTLDGNSSYRPFDIGSGNYAVTISGLTVANGRGNGGGGLINFSTGQVNLDNMTFDSNAITASSGGGGIRHASGGTLNVTGSTFLNNNSTGTGGGGINNFSTSGIVNITNCTFSGNLANLGGGIHNHSTGTTNVTNCTLVSNGGGINNNSGTVSVKNTIAVGNGTDLSGTVTASNNLTGALSTALLSALGNYGGTTQTFALLPGSPALNAGTASGAPATDQRGITRPQQSVVDIGAYESRGFTLTINSGNNQSTAVTSTFANSLKVTVSSSNSEPVDGGQITFTPPGSGASAAIAGNPAIIANGVATTGAVTANAVTGGPYNVSANANGAASAVNYSLTNSCAMISITNPTTTTGTANASFSQTFTQTGAITPVMFSTTSTLPMGLTLAANGTLSGTPTQTGTFPITVKVTDNNGCMMTSATYSLMIGCQTISVTNPGVASGTTGSSFSQMFTQTGGIGTTTFSTTSTLPTGLTLAANGLLSGTPTQTGMFPITVKAMDGNGCPGTGTAYNLMISCGPITVTPPAVNTATLNTTFNQSFTQAGASGTATFMLNSGTLPMGLTLAANGVLSGTPTQTGTFPITVKVNDSNNCPGVSGTYNLTVNPPNTTPFTVSLSDPIACTGENNILSVHAEVTNPNNVAANLNFNASLPAQLTGVAGSCVSSFGTCTVNNATVTVTGNLPAHQTVTIDYKVRVANGTPQGTQLCVDSTASLNGGAPAMVQACTILNCPANPANVQAGGQKAGSVLVFPYYTSNAAQRTDTRLTLSNIGLQSAFVHLFFIDGTSCRQADLFVCLTPNASASFKASEYDPATTGWLLAVAINSDGVPIQNNALIGNAFVNDGAYVDNYAAEAFRANSPAVAAMQNQTALVCFDGSGYDAAPSQFAVEVQSPADAPGQRIVTVGLQGDLITGQLSGASQAGTGLVYNGNEKPFGSFSNFLLGSCQASATISATSPRVPNGMNTMIPSGQSGSLKFNVGAGVGLLMTPRPAAWHGIRGLHKTAQTTATLVIPVLRPVC